MNRAVLRWSGIGLVICALAAIAVSLWLSLRTLNMKPFDGTSTGIALSLTLWGMATAQLGQLLWKRAQPHDNGTKRRFRIQPSVISPLPLGVQVAFAVVQTLFLIAVASLTMTHTIFGIVGQQSVTAVLVVAQAIINFLALIFGSVWLNFRHNESLTG